MSRRARGRTIVAAAGTAVTLGLTAVAATLVTGAVGGHHDNGAESSGNTGPPATAEITRRDMVDTDSATGSLGYGDVTSIGNHRSGTVTWVPAEGQVRRRGQALWRVDTLPTILMYGTLPLYRTLSTGVDGGTRGRCC